MSVFDLGRQLALELPELNIREMEPMSAHSSFRIGGPAEVFIETAGEAQTAALFAALRRHGEKPTVIGRGTNILVRDEGIKGVTVKIGEGSDDMKADGETVSAGSGVSLARLAVFARDNHLAGLEFAHGIPGSLGGAVSMNAGAYGGEMKDVVASVRYLDEQGQVQETAEPGFAYRKSVFSDTDCVILSARLNLRPGKKEDIAGLMEELWEKRSASQPLDKPSAGSTFKRPESGYAAAMIDGAGLKGFAIGGAQVSEKHAGFVINRGGASFADVAALMEHIQKKVFELYGVMLEPEVKILG